MPDEPREPADGDAGADGSTWNADGTDLAKSLVARAKAAGRTARRGSTSSSSSSSSSFTGGKRRWRRAPGAGWSGPGGDDRDPQPLGRAVDKLVDEHGWDEDISVHGVIARWDQIVGEDVATHVVPESYADGVVTVRAASTAWATQVRLLAPQLVRRLNEEIGDGTVTRVEVLAPQAPTWRKGARRVPGRGPRDTYG